MFDDLTLEQCKSLLDDLGGGGGNVLAFHFAKSHEARVEALERIIDAQCDELVSNRALKQKSSEDDLTTQLVSQLRAASIRASHDTFNGGHCDIVVEARDRFVWIAEAKKFRGVSSAQTALAQLSKRYGVASYGRNRGEIILYCFDEGASEKLGRWADNLRDQQEDVTSPQFANLLYFRSQHLCKATELPFYIRHKVVPLYWGPGSGETS